MLRYGDLKETGTSYEQSFCFTENQWQNILTKVQKVSKIGQRTENLNICFLVSFDHDCKNLIFGGEILR